MTFHQAPRKYCILCVDDDLLSLEARAAVLEAAGYSVTAVCCPMMALHYEVSKFHLAVIDFDMPGLNGFQLFLRLRAAHASFPIVLLSGMIRDLPGDVRRVFSSCIDKAEPVMHLLDTIDAYLTAVPDPPECRALRGTQPGLYR